MGWDLCVENINILYTYCIAGAHYGRDIMRIENILQHNGDVGLALVQYRCKPVVAFGCHSALKSKNLNAGSGRD